MTRSFEWKQCRESFAFTYSLFNVSKNFQMLRTLGWRLILIYSLQLPKPLSPKRDENGQGYFPCSSKGIIIGYYTWSTSWCALSFDRIAPFVFAKKSPLTSNVALPPSPTQKKINWKIYNSKEGQKTTFRKCPKGFTTSFEMKFTMKQYEYRFRKHVKILHT